MGAAVLLVFAAIWYLPLFVKHRKIVHEPFRHYLFPFLAGMLAVVLAMVIQVLLGVLTKDVNLSGMAAQVWGATRILIVVAFVEEMLKFVCGYLFLRRIPNLTEAGAMLIIGAAGLGFEIIETAGSGNIVSGLVRGITALHIMFQLWMGKFWWRARQAKLTGDTKGRLKNLAIAFVPPIVIHGLFDWLIFKSVAMHESGAEPKCLCYVLLVTALLLSVAVLVVVIRSSYRTVREEQKAYSLNQQSEVTEDGSVSILEPETETEPETESKTEPEPQQATEAEPESESESETEAEHKTEAGE